MAAGAALALLGPTGTAAATTGPLPPQDTALFRHGIASGDPVPDGVLLWTRVTPTPDATPGSGRGAPTDVGWAVATDPDFRRIVKGGIVRADPASDLTVKVDVRGLAADTRHWYRFGTRTGLSAVGATRTAPKPDAALARLRLGVVSCSNWQAGYFTPYRYLARRGDLDAVVHLGDYVYEYGPGEYGARGVTVRPHDPPKEMVTLEDYRRRHAQYKTDPDLQALHAQVPWIVTLDDHESANDAYVDGAENHQPATEGPWPARRAAALQAFREWQPVRNSTAPVYRRLRFGRLAEISMLDLRSYRSKQADRSAAVDDPTRTITGRDQLGFLVDGLTRSTAQWKLVGNPVVIAPVLVPPLPGGPAAAVPGLLKLPQGGVAINPDQWDGYTADRRTVFQALSDKKVRDAVFLTGDIHSSWANDLPIDAGTYPVTPSVGTEFVCTSVTSDNLDDQTMSPPRTSSIAVETAIQTTNRHVKFLEFDSHGASVLDVTPQAVQMDWFYVSDRTNPQATLAHGRSWRTRTGTQQVEPVAGPVPVGARR